MKGSRLYQSFIDSVTLEKIKKMTYDNKAKDEVKSYGSD